MMKSSKRKDQPSFQRTGGAQSGLEDVVLADGMRIAQMLGKADKGFVGGETNVHAITHPRMEHDVDDSVAVPQAVGRFTFLQQIPHDIVAEGEALLKIKPNSTGMKRTCSLSSLRSMRMRHGANCEDNDTDGAPVAFGDQITGTQPGGNLRERTQRGGNRPYGLAVKTPLRSRLRIENGPAPAEARALVLGFLLESKACLNCRADFSI